MNQKCTATQPRRPSRQAKGATATRGDEYIKKIATFLQTLDGATYVVKRRRKHRLVVVSYNGKAHFQTIPTTASDWRGPARAVSDIRHGLGLVGTAQQSAPPVREDGPRRRNWGKPGRAVRPASTPWPKREADRAKEPEDRFHAPLQALLARMLADEAAAQAEAVPIAPGAKEAAAKVVVRTEVRIRLRTPFLGQRAFFQTVEI